MLNRKLNFNSQSSYKGKKGGQKGGHKKVVDPYTNKDCYDIKAPSMFTTRNVGKILFNRLQGTKGTTPKKGRMQGAMFRPQ